MPTQRITREMVVDAAFRLARERGCEAVDYRERKRLKLEDYDTVIYGGCFHAGAGSAMKKWAWGTG